ncbi:hypothetical protein LQE92_06385 [Lacrimispora sp. NSJ-141]|uniref:Ig-like domain-containing protein n=1 Tax=Lientehia hominis TaxID=2897778 RepID=A0AAP2RHI0_9FIRM|nr:hypothetical protein [Lientehia hominis]MCD2492257.1 hypothetical protein [Lientehia hominis]
MKQKGMSLLALLLVFSMLLSPLSNIGADAAASELTEESGAALSEEMKEPAAEESSAASEEKKEPEPEESSAASEEKKEPAAKESSTASEDKKEPAAAERTETGKESKAESSAAAKESSAAETLAASESGAEPTSVADAGEKNNDTVQTALLAANVDEQPVKPTAAISGVMVLKNDGSQYGMFPITNAACTVKGDVIEISFQTGAKKTFDWLYLGYQSDGSKPGYFTGVRTGNTCEFTIQVPVSSGNNWIPVSVGRSDQGTWSENYLWMSIPKVLLITKQPEAVSKKAGEIAVLSVEADGEGVTYQWQYSSDGSGWTDCTGDSAQAADYSFTMEAVLAGQYRCMVKDSAGAEAVTNVVKVSAASEQEGYLANDGITAVYGSDDAKKPGQAYTMFKIAASKAVVKGDGIEVTIWVSPASSGKFSYDAIYIGKKDDDPKEPVVFGETDADKNLQKFQFTVSSSAMGGEVHFVPRSASKGTWSTSSSLAFQIPAPDNFKKPSEITITSQPASETVTGAGAEVILTAEASGEDGTALSYQWQYSADGSQWTDCIGDSAKTAEYRFTMSEDLAGQYRCVITDGNGTTATSSTAAVRMPSAPVITGSTVKVVKDNGAEFAMFKVGESTVIADGEELEITISTANTSFDKLYLGFKDDASKTPVTMGTKLASGGWTFTFRVLAADKGKVLPVSLGYPEGSVKDWYTNLYLWIYIPDEGIETLPTETDTIKAIAGGTGASYNNFTVVSSKAVLKGNTMILTLYVKGNTWSKLYQGVQSDTNKTVTCTGSYDRDTDRTAFTFQVPAKKQGMNIPITPGNDSGWFSYARDLFINVPNLAGITNTMADGTYDLYGSAYPVSNYTSLCFERGSSLTINGSMATVTLVTQAREYDKLYIGLASDSDSVKDAKSVKAVPRTDIGDTYKSFTFTIPTADLGKEISYVVHAEKSNVWSEKSGSFFINGLLDKTGDLPDQDPEPADPAVPSDGSYKVTVDSSAAMFRVMDCILTVKNGKMSAVLTLSGTGYDYLYLGTAADAEKADKFSWAPFVKDASGKYTYTIPVAALDQGIAVAAHSIKNDKWYDRTLTFRSETMKKIGDISGGEDEPVTPVDPDNGKDDGNQPDVIPDNDGKADSESKYESDTSGSTGRVNSATTLADGVYKPDKFSWSGGTGRVRISCNKITVKNGQAYATLVFSSDSYQYVKANGNTYYATKSGGTATVVIPVALNKNNKILGMTTKMSATHEIEYTIFIYLAAAANGEAAGENSNEKLDETAPQIIGLEYQSEAKLDYAEYFKIYHYDQDIVLLEIDLTKDTARDPERLTEEKDGGQEKTKEPVETDIVTEDGEELVPSEGEIAAELYKGNIVKYLLVPDDTEIPVGLEQDMIIVRMPVDKTYAASDEILEMMETLGILDNLAAVGCEQEECGIDSVAERMTVKDGEEEADVIFGGQYDLPDYKALIKKGTNLAVLPGELLPREKEAEELTAEEQTERFEESAGNFAMFNIPVVIDRSVDEETELAKYEWIKVYGVLFGCEEKADQLFEAAVKKAAQQESR